MDHCGQDSDISLIVELRLANIEHLSSRDGLIFEYVVVKSILNFLKFKKFSWGY